METKKIAKGVTFAYHQTNQFKTSLISFNFIAPLAETAAEDSLVIHLLSRTCAKHPSIFEMNRKLASLYGASISPSVSKIGEELVLSLDLVTVDDRFSLEGENICKECVELLCSCIFRPNVTPEGFLKESLEQEKRLLIEKIESENDDKRLYAQKRMIEEMCSQETYGLSKFGTVERINTLTEKEVFDRWLRLLVNCPIQINYIGSADPSVVENVVKPYFDQIQRKAVWPVKTEFITSAYEQKTIKEKQNVKQGKLVIGYRAGMTYDRDNFPALKLMTMIFGGGTFSKLFMNVREKMSLCYYCSAGLYADKGIIIVQSGVETENAEKALEAIENELDEVRKGNFSEETLVSAKLSFCDALKSVKDSAAAISSWMMSYTVNSVYFSPEELAEMINKVSKEEIMVAANMITKDTVYILESDSQEK